MPSSGLTRAIHQPVGEISSARLSLGPISTFARDLHIPSTGNTPEAVETGP